MFVNLKIWNKVDYYIYNIISYNINYYKIYKINKFNKKINVNIQSMTKNETKFGLHCNIISIDYYIIITWYWLLRGSENIVKIIPHKPAKTRAKPMVKSN